MSNKDMIKPFTTEVEESAENIAETKEVVREAPTPTTVIKNGVELIQPFTTIDTPIKRLYLILKVYTDVDACDGEAEQIRDFEFFTGTSQELYDRIKEEIIESDDFSVRQKIDVMKSIIFADSPKITIGLATKKTKPCSMYKIMKNLREQGKIVDETSFDIEDYKYDETGELTNEQEE